jgi:hypothetical protein
MQNSTINHAMMTMINAAQSHERNVQLRSIDEEEQSDQNGEQQDETKLRAEREELKA